MNKWLYSTNHKNIGILYFMFATWVGMIKSSMEMIIWIKLGSCGAIINNDQLSNSIVKGHAFIMIVFMPMPFMIGGFGNFLVSLMIVSADKAYSRMTTMSVWLFAPSIMLFTLSQFISSGVKTGWTYPPLSSNIFHSDASMALAIFCLHIAEISSLMGATNFISTIINMTHKNCSLDKTPLMVWFILPTAILLFVSLPVLADAITML